MYCRCHRRVSLRGGVSDLFDEFKELGGAGRGERADELSDVMYAVGRLFGSVLGREYVRMPFDGAHREKISERMQEYGCIRSRRWLVAGRCPSGDL